MKILTALLILFSLNANAAGPAGSAIAPATYIGAIATKGDMVYSKYSSSIKATGALAAHASCKKEFGDDSRAAEYEDFKYIITNLTKLKYWVIDPYAGKTNDAGTYTYLRKDGKSFSTTSAEDGNCNDFTSTSSSYYGPVLNKAVKQLDNLACNETAYIACIK